MKIKPYDGRHDLQIKTLVECIQHKMAEHVEKGEWSDIPVDDLMVYLRNEVDELQLAINNGNLIEGLREVGDVGACLVMVAETLMRKRTLTSDVITDIQTRNAK